MRKKRIVPLALIGVMAFTVCTPLAVRAELGTITDGNGNTIIVDKSKDMPNLPPGKYTDEKGNPFEIEGPTTPPVIIPTPPPAPPSGGGSTTTQRRDNPVSTRPASGDNTRLSTAAARIKAAKDGDQVIIDAGKTYNIPMAVFTALKGKDVDLVINISDYTWTINGLTVGDLPTGKNINLRVQTVTDASLSALAGGNDIVSLRLSHTGAFPFEATLTWEVGEDYAGQTIHLYAYNETTGELDYVAEVDVDEDGLAVLELGYAEASRYVLSTQGPAGPTAAPPATDNGGFTAAPTPQRLILNTNSPANASGVKPFIMRYVGDGYNIGLISLRAFADFVGATPVWDAAMSTATVSGTDARGGYTQVSLISGDTNIIVNGTTYDIGAFAGADNLSGLCSALNENGALYLPLRAVTNAFGGTLEWDSATETVTITQ